MTAQAANTPRFIHVLAVCFGTMVIPLVLAFVMLLVELLGVGPRDATPEFLLAMVIAYAAAGGAFGLLWPGKSWRWGVWIGLLPFVWASLVSASATLVVACALVLPACVGALVASRRSRRRVRVI